LTGRKLIKSLTAGLKALTGEQPDPARVNKLLSYLDLLIQWNEAYNLTAVCDPLEMISRHLLDSLSVMPWVDDGHLLDAGTGAGLPGIPLAITRPGMTVTLLDSAGKKIRFLRHIKRRMELENVRLVQARLESWQTNELPTRIVSRAFSSLSTFVSASRHLAGPDARFLAMKGKAPGDELEGLPAWLRVDSVEKLVVPGLQEDRHLVIMSLSK